MSDELFSIGVGGKKGDAALHEEIEGDVSAQSVASRLAVDRAIGLGMDPETARLLYGEVEDAVTET